MKRRDTFHLRWRGKISGPFTWDEIEARLGSHEIGLLHELQKGEVWTTIGEHLAGGDAESTSATTFVIKSSGTGSSAPPANPSAAHPPPGPLVKPPPSSLGPPRRRWVFAAFGLAFGFLGAHQFYAGNTPRGLLLLSVSIVTWLAGFGVMLPWLWAMGEVILTDRDGRGRLMRWAAPPFSPT